MLTHYENDSSTGEWLRLMADMEHEELPIDIEQRSDGWVVGGVLVVDTLERAIELTKEAA